MCIDSKWIVYEHRYKSMIAQNLCVYQNIQTFIDATHDE